MSFSRICRPLFRKCISHLRRCGPLFRICMSTCYRVLWDTIHKRQTWNTEHASFQNMNVSFTNMQAFFYNLHISFTKCRPLFRICMSTCYASCGTACIYMHCHRRDSQCGTANTTHAFLQILNISFLCKRDMKIIKKGLHIRKRDILWRTQNSPFYRFWMSLF